MTFRLRITLFLSIASVFTSSSFALETFLKGRSATGSDLLFRDKALAPDGSIYFAFERRAGQPNALLLDDLRFFDGTKRAANATTSIVAKMAPNGQWEWLHWFTGDYEEITITCIDASDSRVVITESRLEKR